VDDVFLIEQPARDVDESYFQISLDLANSWVHSIHPLAVEHALECLSLLIHLGYVVLIVKSKLLELLKIDFWLLSGW
jgi:hypothetical protein